MNRFQIIAQAGAPGAVTIDHTNTASGDLAFTYNNSTVSGAITANHSGAGTFDFNSTSLDVDSSIDINATDGGAFDFFATNLDVEILKSDSTACDSAVLTPFDIVLRTASGEERAGGQTNSSTGCAELSVTGLSSGTYLLYLEHDEPIEGPESAEDGFSHPIGGGTRA